MGNAARSVPALQPGAPLIKLAHVPPGDEPPYAAGFLIGHVPPAPVDFAGVSRLFFDSLALSAWKQYGGERWALRVNPSSGNLHPTEGYLICGPVPGLTETPMVAHYAPREHALEVRATFPLDVWQALTADLLPDAILVGLTSIHWREAWKYGQRAYRYCQHDVGHALGGHRHRRGGAGLAGAPARWAEHGAGRRRCWAWRTKPGRRRSTPIAWWPSFRMEKPWKVSATSRSPAGDGRKLPPSRLAGAAEPAQLQPRRVGMDRHGRGRHAETRDSLRSAQRITRHASRFTFHV